MLLGTILGILIGALFAGVIIWIVGRLGLGLEVDGFGPAFIAGIVIAILGGVVSWLGAAMGTSLGLTIGGGLVGAIIHLVIAALVIYFAASMVRGLRTKGFGGALIAAIAIGVVTWLIGLVVSAIL